MGRLSPAQKERRRQGLECNYGAAAPKVPNSQVGKPRAKQFWSQDERDMFDFANETRHMLNNWEQGFLDNIDDRWKLKGKQPRILKRIYEKCLGVD